MKKASVEYVALFVQDVREHPTAYKASVVAFPEAVAMRALFGLNADEVKQMTRDLKAERRAVAKAMAK